ALFLASRQVYICRALPGGADECVLPYVVSLSFFLSCCFAVSASFDLSSKPAGGNRAVAVAEFFQDLDLLGEVERSLPRPHCWRTHRCLIVVKYQLLTLNIMHCR